MAKKYYNPDEKDSEKSQEKTYKVKKGLGFINGKRSFFENGRNILLVEGQLVSKDDYDAFTEGAQALLFEK